MMIDTLGHVKRLVAVGVNREQAEAHAEIFRDEVATQVASKADVDALATKIDTLAARARSDIQTLEVKIENLAVTLEVKIENLAVTLEAKIENLGVKTKADLDGIESRMEIKRMGLEARMLMLNWMCGFTLAAVMAVLWKLMK